MNVTAIRHVAFEDLDMLEPLLENLAVIVDYSTAPEHTQFKFPDTMPNSIVSHSIDVICLATRDKYHEKYH